MSIYTRCLVFFITEEWILKERSLISDQRNARVVTMNQQSDLSSALNLPLSHSQRLNDLRWLLEVVFYIDFDYS